MSEKEVTLTWMPGGDPAEGRWPGLRTGTREVVDGMVVDWDVPVTLRDGVTVYMDVFTPTEPAGPVPTLLTWSPYGKHGAKTLAMFPNTGVPADAVSTYAAWESPDPLYWTKRNFAVVNGDTRGSWGSEGNLEILGPQEAIDGYDVVEWIAEQPWSNGRVGTAGVSYLAVIQYEVAALRPPHLACINPWEGFSDFYREFGFHGGIPETNFIQFMQWSCRCSFGQVENLLGMHAEHLLLDDYNSSKSAPDLAQIEVPTYLVADWGDQGLHTRGTLEAYKQISSEHKYLEVHGRKKWQYYYSPESLRRQEAFYRRFLLDEEDALADWSPVSIEIRDRAWQGEVRRESEWPIARARHERLYLDATRLGFSSQPIQEVAVAGYDSRTTDDHLDFTHIFDETTEITGGMRLRLWMRTPDAEDGDVFVQIDKIDADGEVVPFVAMAMLDDGPVALGWLRLSHRELDPERSTDEQPWHPHTRQIMLAPVEVVPVDIEIWPSSTRFSAGESLRLRIQGNDIFRYDLPTAQLHENSVNRGRHEIFAGGLFDSYLVVPVIGN